MVAMVTFVAMLIHVYSIGYMGHDARPRYRFFAYLSLFTFAMLMLVTADNLAQLFFGWEGVGLCSYLLIGYWYDRPSACAAAIKAFVVNRIADLPFAVGLALIFFKFGSIEFSVIFPAVAQHGADTYALFGSTFSAIEVIGFLLFIGAMGKSAQLGLHVWLPDAMEGPTPVSALIHAATMVTAGVFLMARMSPLMEYAPYALGFVTFIGASTALFAATVGCTQNDIKRVIAYSTCSQLGYMFAAAGVGAYEASRVPSDHPCLLQGAAVPVGGVGHPCDVGRAGHAQDGRAGAADPGDLHGDVDRQSRACRHSATGRVLFERRNHLRHLRRRHWHWPVRLHLHAAGRLPDRVLFLAPAVHDLPRPIPSRPPHAGTCARKPMDDAGSAGRSGVRRGVCRLGAGQLVHRFWLLSISGTAASSTVRITR